MNFPFSKGEVHWAEQGVQSNSLGRVNVMRHAQLWSVSTPWNWYYIGPPASLQSAKNGDTSVPQLRLIIIIIMAFMGIAITPKFTCNLQSLSETSWFDKCDFRRILQFTCAKIISIYYLFHIYFTFFQCEMHWTGKLQDLSGIYFCEMRNGSEAYPTTISNQWTSLVHWFESVTSVIQSCAGISWVHETFLISEEWFLLGGEGVGRQVRAPRCQMTMLYSYY